MVVTNFDGRNVQIVVDASCLKALRYVLSNVTPKQKKDAADAMRFDSFEITAEDVAGFISTFTHVVKPITDIVTMNDEPEKPAKPA